MQKVTIIAEAGVNHNGCLKTALRLVEQASESGADIIKFQTFFAEKLVNSDVSLADYQTHGALENSQLKMLKSLELSPSMHRSIIKHCSKHRIEFLSTGFDLESIIFLNTCGLARHKIPSGEITNYPLLQAIGRSQLPTLLSTGMAELHEVEEAVATLYEAGLDKSKLTLLQCTTEYPAPDTEVNLRAMTFMRDHFGVAVGFSDHTVGIEVSLAAVALGATVIEKHFTLDKTSHGPDHKASLEPSELKDLVKGIRRIENALGNPKKAATPSEIKNRLVTRKSIVAARDISAGEIFSDENLTTKRAGEGLSPMKWSSLIGTKASKSYKKDEKIIWL